MKYGDVRSIAEHRPVGAFKRHILVIVQNSDLVFHHWLFVHVFRSLIKSFQIVKTTLPKGRPSTR